MLPEYEVELVDAMLAERRLQIDADVQASTIQPTAERGPSLLQRLYGLFRVDPTQLPASHQAALRMQGQLPR